MTGPIYAFGGQLPGMGLYLVEGRPVFLFNAINGEKFSFAGEDPLATGHNQLSLRLARSSALDEANRADWTVTLNANGEQVAQGVMHIEMPRMMGISATFSVGLDAGDPVLEGYRPGTPLDARIGTVTFDFFAR